MGPVTEFGDAIQTPHVQVVKWLQLATCLKVKT
jgi:hypothetical protein